MIALSLEAGPLVGILVGALIAALGYVGKLIVEGIRGWRREREERLARLFQLRALLRASHVAYDVQNDLARRLAQELRTKYSEDLPDIPGFERMFAHLCGRFDSEEANLHRVVRGYTEHALRPLNESILAWLRADIDYRTARGKTETETRLARMLNQLDAHLSLWLAKYEAWIPNQPEHALVYLDDEEAHGLGFPKGTEETLDALLGQSGR